MNGHCWAQRFPARAVSFYGPTLDSRIAISRSAGRHPRIALAERFLAVLMSEPEKWYVAKQTAAQADCLEYPYADSIGPCHFLPR